VIFSKYHALGNDYIVINPDDILSEQLTAVQIQRICDRHYGIGSDGILLGPLPNAPADFGLRIFNPDGSEAEKSGSGIRIFSRCLWDKGLVQAEPFTIATKGGVVEAQLFEEGRMVRVEMGRVSFHSKKIPVTGPPREVVNERIAIGGEVLNITAATIGNPHCVVMEQELSPERAKYLGPLIESSGMFSRRINVQFMKILDRRRIQIEIWERGAGYTLASGSSSCAAAAVAHRLGLCDAEIAVQMPGGVIHVRIAEDYQMTMTGPVTKVAVGQISPEIFRQ
jgi:diaminopimelate epimerase